jgi:hypothetical protein
MLLKDTKDPIPLYNDLAIKYGQHLTFGECRPGRDKSLMSLFFKDGVPHHSHSYPSLMVFLRQKDSKGWDIIHYDGVGPLQQDAITDWLEKTTALYSVRSVNSREELERLLIRPSFTAQGAVLLVTDRDKGVELYHNVSIKHRGQFVFGENQAPNNEFISFLSSFLTLLVIGVTHP